MRRLRLPRYPLWTIVRAIVFILLILALFSQFRRANINEAKYHAWQQRAGLFLQQFDVERKQHWKLYDEVRELKEQMKQKDNTIDRLKNPQPD